MQNADFVVYTLFLCSININMQTTQFSIKTSFVDLLTIDTSTVKATPASLACPKVKSYIAVANRLQRHDICFR